MSDPELTLVPGVRVPGPVDPTGAGDSATAGCVLALAAGAGPAEAALVGNLVASITVQQLATTGTARPSELPRAAGDVAGTSQPSSQQESHESVCLTVTAIKPVRWPKRENKLALERDSSTPPGSPAALRTEPRQPCKRRRPRSARPRCRPPSHPGVRRPLHQERPGTTLISLLEQGWLTHLATNGAGIIHDWEFAYQGMSGEDVRRYTAEGQFGIWEQTGLYLNLAFLVGAYEGLGYGASIGAMVQHDGLGIPAENELLSAMQVAQTPAADSASLEKAAAAADLLAIIRKLHLPEGLLRIEHPHKAIGLQAAALRKGIPLTGHPMFGHDIIYTHPANRGAAIGRVAERDFLSFVDSVSQLQGGVYLSVGSAVMSPMIFEKSLSMARNVAHQSGTKIDDFSIHVVDLAASTWDWQSAGEPPMDNPAYYLRFCKTFSRMGGRMSYTSADNRASWWRCTTRWRNTPTRVTCCLPSRPPASGGSETTDRQTWWIRHKPLACRRRSPICVKSA